MHIFNAYTGLRVHEADQHLRVEILECARCLFCGIQLIHQLAVENEPGVDACKPISVIPGPLVPQGIGRALLPAPDEGACIPQNRQKAPGYGTSWRFKPFKHLIPLETWNLTGGLAHQCIHVTAGHPRSQGFQRERDRPVTQPSQIQSQGQPFDRSRRSVPHWSPAQRPERCAGT